MNNSNRNRCRSANTIAIAIWSVIMNDYAHVHDDHVATRKEREAKKESLLPDRDRWSEREVERLRANEIALDRWLRRPRWLAVTIDSRWPPIDDNYFIVSGKIWTPIAFDADVAVAVDMPTTCWRGPHFCGPAMLGKRFTSGNIF